MSEKEFKRGDVVQTKTGLVGEVLEVTQLGPQVLYRVYFRDKRTQHLPAASLQPANIVEEIARLYRGPM